MNFLFSKLSALGAWWRTARNGKLTLTIAGRVLSFARLGDLMFCLEPRISIPATRLPELLVRPAGELAAEAESLRNLELRLRGVVEDYERHGLSCGAGLQSLGLQVISKDHDWRAILSQIADLSPARDDFLHAALSVHLQYLAARREALRLCDVLRAVATSRPIQAQDAPERATFVGTVETLTGAADMRRLPPGEAVVLHLGDGRRLPIKLAKYDFSLAHDEQWSLITDDGRRYVLREGVNSVGRSRDNDVALDAVFRNVSRKHLLAQPMGHDSIVLTDLSSSGTYIPPAAIAS